MTCGKCFPFFLNFREIINNPSLASKVHADTGGYGVSWSDDLDLDSETIWEDGVFIRIESVDPSLALASSLARAREYAMLTQNNSPKNGNLSERYQQTGTW